MSSSSTSVSPSASPRAHLAGHKAGLARRLPGVIGPGELCEGVEIARQHVEVSQLSSNSCQGFYFAGPIPAEGVAGRIHNPFGDTIPHLPASPAGDWLTIDWGLCA
jgi:hypothetical protein